MTHGIRQREGRRAPNSMRRCIIYERRKQRLIGADANSARSRNRNGGEVQVQFQIIIRA